MNASLFDRLVAIGFSPKVIRGDVYLDNMRVHDIIAGLPINYTRRRYSNATFCWVEAYVAGWFSLGDPWPAVTPKRKSVEDQIESYRKQHEPVCTSNPSN